MREQGVALEYQTELTLVDRDLCHVEPMEPAPDASPIPPGFFKDLPFPVVSKSGRPAIESYVTGNDWKNAKLIELLYCVQGCHRGDGVQ